MNRTLAQTLGHLAWLWLGVPLIAGPAGAEGVRLVPVASLSLLGGQYFLDGEAASFNGRASAFVAPVVRLSETNELIPVYQGSYYGTQDVQELAGGGVLTRQRQTHTASLAWLHRREFDKYKPRLTTSRGMVRETTDETWGKGLFDYDSFGAGFEAEHERSWGTVSEGYDFYLVRYPNYDTLLSQSESALDPATFSELSQNAGAHVLDSQNHHLGLGLTLFPEPAVLRTGYDLTWRRFPDQATIGELGNFASSKRSDWVQSLSARLSRDFRHLQLAAAARIDSLQSNQNSFDAARTKFVEDSYDYWEFALGPSFTLAFKGGGSLSFDTGWTQRLYGGRLVQDANGAYSGSKIRQTSWLTALSVRYPVLKGLSARLAASTLSAASNMRYEANYRYNYQANTYMLGIEWEL